MNVWKGITADTFSSFGERSNLIMSFIALCFYIFILWHPCKLTKSFESGDLSSKPDSLTHDLGFLVIDFRHGTSGLTY